MINYGYVVSDFAFWFKNATLNLRQPDIHLNLWVGYNNESSFIDIGIRFYKEMKIRKYFVYVPFEVSLSDVEDLFETFSYEDVVQGIFNKTCEVIRKVSGEYIELSYDGEKEKILPLSQLGITVSRCGQGSILCLNLKNIKFLLKTTNIYVRWRLSYLALSRIMKKRQLRDFSIDSPYIMSNYRYFFKINEIRSLPLDVKGKINSNTKYFDKIVMILVNNNKIEINTENCYKIRVLEEEQFKNYKPNKYTGSNSNVYQWHISNSNSCNFLIEAQLRKINWFSVLIYFLIILMTGLFTDGLFECIKDYILK